MAGEISLQSARLALKQNPNIWLIDVRSTLEFQRGHIKGATSVPLDSINKVKRLINSNEAIIFVYCKTGMRASQAKDLLEDMGYTRVTNIGGVLGWPLVQGL